MDGWIKEMCFIYIYKHTHTHIYIYIYNVILFSLKKKEILPYATTLMNLEDNMLSEVSQSQKDKYCII